jgi:L-rhamnose mutarotase
MVIMIRKSFVMSVVPGFELEYKKRHNPIWPEWEAVLKEHGVLSYSIFMDPATRQLFAYAEIEDEARWNAIAQTPVWRRWWAYMKDIMPANPDGSPVLKELQEVFHMYQSRATTEGTTDAKQKSAGYPP